MRHTAKLVNGDFPLIFERSQPGRRAAQPPKPVGESLETLLGAEHLRAAPPKLPEVSELELVRHYTGLAHRQFSIDGNFYPLGSCTMKYNPKVNEETAKLFADLHPYADPDAVQGALELLYNLQHDLAEITGMDAVTLQPAAGAHGELAGILIIRAHHERNGEGEQRRVVIVPDGAHGTNPATATMVGYDVKEVPTAPNGEVDLDAFKAVLGPDVAAIMLTNPIRSGCSRPTLWRSRGSPTRSARSSTTTAQTRNAIVGRARPAIWASTWFT